MTVPASDRLRYGVCDCEYPCSCVELDGVRYGSWKDALDAVDTDREAARSEARAWEANHGRQVELKRKMHRMFVSARDDRDRFHRLFNRIEAAITHHRRDCEANDVPDTHDEALWAARDRVLRDSAEGGT